MNDYIDTRSTLHRYVKSANGFGRQKLTIFKLSGIDKIIVENLEEKNKAYSDVYKYNVYFHVGYKEHFIYVHKIKPVYTTPLPEIFDSGKDVRLTSTMLSMLIKSTRFFDMIRLKQSILLEIDCNTNEVRKCLSITKEYIDQLFEEISDTIINLED